MKRDLPPLNSLRVFAVAARHCHFTRASLELGVTQAAVSRQISVLEKWLGVELFERSQSKLVLTEEGTRYWTAVRAAFNAIEDATTVILNERHRNTVVVCAYTTFALLWLLPRLSEFYEQHPRTDLQIMISSASFHAPSDADVVIRHGPIHQAPNTSIFPDMLAPVCSPALLRQRKNMNSVADLKSLPMLHSRHRKQDWALWCDSLGEKETVNDGFLFDSSSLAYAAAKQGMGLVVAQLHLVEPDLTSGDLVMPIGHTVRNNSGYFYLRSERAKNHAPANAFCSWLKAQGAHSTMSH